MKNETKILRGKIDYIYCDNGFGRYDWFVVMKNGEHYKCDEDIINEIIKKLPPMKFEVQKKRVITHILKVL